jgi:hypothetical protein
MNPSPAKGAVIGLVVALSGATILYRLLILHRMEQTSALFIGIPAILAILIAVTVKTKTVTGGIITGITLALLILAPILREGIVCILMASPLFYLVGIVVGLVMDRAKSRRKTTLSCIAIVLLPMCMEGVIPGWAFHRGQTVEVMRVVNAPSAAVEAALNQSPRVSTGLPGFLRIGFPRPLEAHGEGLSLGATRTIHFSGAEGHPPGDLVMRVVDRRPQYVRFETVSDGSKLTHWLLWDGSEVTWRAIDASHTEVTWRVFFERELDPAWYFAPMERFAVHEAASYLIDANATPARAR